ncbi:N-acetylglucosaminyldiphosphodolichol N- acetylglucosaminyltransferase Alg13 [Schizosaccharomyces cryophilus OY26]|uniref:UDP-N-acetylglucosamine transferase subunit ALG13 n=1 Tax=Schizosaccharomyces cryophilus (strain OY26 / ATCC MYA-4695 / CBS 11777 / NBRC 106824 / NRRL Y48691) TaxID=653667 RepID=S9VSL6_SCHCR|nr:N-acetylglucosaminyldiphosphodolichol N- acetylglucosaminyltransferase Alg13 [Schizosaccharomyces cryophilus OY26]EPY50873.1 N-acetylglucosaminyldiphosphodolichol N- acetylglucosaminyltransferase Alg13 [Schizosaccharomyces cryophilus OY26]
MKAFVTVGSTRFDELVSGVLHVNVQYQLLQHGITQLIVQFGNGREAFGTPSPIEGISISGFDYAPEIGTYIESSSIVISHAGAGSILQSLRAQKPLIVVPNESLMDNHQLELSNKLASLQYLITCSYKDLAQGVEALFNTKLKPFPNPEYSAFQKVLSDVLTK